ncbi:MAG: radical SAM family heme chaperone HemW, partial [bacterium]|nr:radical SAM family heme chaperone HemW [bacterium]
MPPTALQQLNPGPHGPSGPAVHPATAMATTGGVRSLYLHVPFCSHKCHYCDFYSIVDTRDRQAAFVDRLIEELSFLSRFASGGPLLTMFVGGGTPSMLEVPLWQRLISHLEREFDLSAIRAGVGEWTVECNPDSVTAELAGVLVAGGVNRISMGAQSFNAAHLRTLERTHNPDNVPVALATVRAAGIRRTNIDLIFGVPGQTLADWRSDLAIATDLGTQHISCYDLTYEPGTAMTARLKRGDFEPADEDVEVEMFEATIDTLAAAGLDRYEVSNYAMPGEECRHNLAYWRQSQWLAAGPSASAFVEGHRWKNVPRLDDYLHGAGSAPPPVRDHETPDAARLVKERLMTGLRLREGLQTSDLCEAADAARPGSSGRIVAAAAKAVERGQMSPD